MFEVDDKFPFKYIPRVLLEKKTTDDIDKKIKELMKVCNSFEIKPPTYEQINKLILKTIPAMKDKNIEYREKIIKYHACKQDPPYTQRSADGKIDKQE